MENIDILLNTIKYGQTHKNCCDEYFTLKLCVLVQVNDILYLSQFRCDPIITIDFTDQNVKISSGLKVRRKWCHHVETVASSYIH